MPHNRKDIEEYVMKTLLELSRDWDYTAPIEPESLLFTELGFESLDAVVLGTAIQEHYGVQMPFAALLAEIGEQRRDLSIRELVDFADAHVNAHAATRAAGALIQ